MANHESAPSYEIPNTPEELEGLKEELRRLLTDWPARIPESFSRFNSHILEMTPEGNFRQLSSSNIVPGHLQTPAYIEKLLASLEPNKPREARMHAARARIARSAILMASNAQQEYLLSPRIYEDPYPGVNRFTLRGQLKHLITLPEQRPQVDVRLLSQEVEPSENVSIDIVSTDGTRTYANFEALGQYTFDLSNHGTKDATTQFEAARDLALPTDESHQLLRKAYERLGS